jgi:integrase
VPHEDLIRKTLDKATAEGKAYNTVLAFSHRLSELSIMADLLNPEAVKSAIGKTPLKNSSKASMALAYDWFCKTNNIQWQKPRYKWELGTPIIPTTDNVTKIISASSERYATIFTIMAETGIEGEELHRLHRNKIDTERGIISIDGTKGHTSGTYKLKPHVLEMLKRYLAKNPQEYPFPKPKAMAEIWRTVRNRVADNLKQPELKNIPMKNLRNYSGAKLYNSHPDPILVMRHLRHKKLETTMHYIRAIVIDGEEEYTVKVATDTKQATELIEKGFQYVTGEYDDGGKIFRKRK